MIDILPTLAFGYINDCEITVMSLSSDQLVFRFDKLMNIREFQIKLKMFNPASYTYENYNAEATITLSENNNFYYTYKANIKIANTDAYVSLLNIYDLINERKNNNHPLKKVTSFERIIDDRKTYPYEKDIDHFSCYEEQIHDWFAFDAYTCEWKKDYLNLMKNKEFAFSINNPDDYSSLKGNFIDYFAHKFEKNNLQNHPLYNVPISRIYIGNEFCPNLFPDLETLKWMIDKLISTNYKITLCYPAFQESRIGQVSELLNYIDSISKAGVTIEFTVNDWGLLHYIKENNINVEFILGRLLNKRKKDPRFSYWRGYDIDNPKNKVNNLNHECFTDFLHSYHVNRIEFEDYSQLIEIPVGQHSLHFPYYQINTSTFCNLFSDVNNKNQNNIMKCNCYCSHIYYDYAKHLHMIGSGNSIFGFNKNSILFDLNKLAYYLDHHIDRIVLTL